MYENTDRCGGYRWVLAAILMAMLSGCGGDDEEQVPRQSEPGSRRECSAACSSNTRPSPDLTRSAALASARGHARMDSAPTTQTERCATLADLAGLPHPLRQEAQPRSITRSRSGMRASRTYMVEGLAPGTYYFAVTAFNSRNL